jgi:hypothetical protein
MVNKESMHKYLIDQISGIDDKLSKVFPGELPEFAGESDQQIMQNQAMASQYGMQLPSDMVDEDGQLLPQDPNQQYMNQQGQQMPQEGEAPPEEDEMAQESQGYEG